MAKHSIKPKGTRVGIILDRAFKKAYRGELTQGELFRTRDLLTSDWSKLTKGRFEKGYKFETVEFMLEELNEILAEQVVYIEETYDQEAFEKTSSSKLLKLYSILITYDLSIDELKTIKRKLTGTEVNRYEVKQLVNEKRRSWTVE
jgi:hypothetical protein